jgi:predicted ATPase/class 3 adenylate cyclase/DNA-binding CsgD family transcriptional regulator
MNAEFPSGTITLLFTDIEGSTRLLQQLGEQYTTLLAQQQQILREACEMHNGRMMDSQGDSLFVAFPRAIDAIKAVVQSQRALTTQTWMSDVNLRVRMGLHTGEPQISAVGYVGIDVHRAARIAAAAHGGQVLLSQTTYDLVVGELPEGITLRDLGEHRLKDLRQPKHLYQLVIAGLPSDFPPIKSLEALTNNLPTQLTSFIGRERELEEIKRLVSTYRLVTLTGPGGVGKTSLALHTARDLYRTFPDGAQFVALSAIHDPTLIIPTIAQTLGLAESPDQLLFDSLKDYLRDSQMLLLLDNFEQVISAAPLLTELLSAANALKLLVTSREALRLRGEQEFPLAPLELSSPAQMPGPLSVESWLHYPSIALFVQRAQAIQPGFQLTTENAAAVAEICARLDGLPLALELAAARIKLLPPQAMLTRLQESSLSLLTGGTRDAPERQQTLRNTVQWSYDLLTTDEQRTFRWLSVFVGGCTLDAASNVISISHHLASSDVLDNITSLINKSLVRQTESNAEARLVMLETIREFSLERLAQEDELEAAQHAHAHYYLSLAEETEQRLTGREQKTWLNRLGREQDNLRAALHWGLEYHEADPSTEFTLSAAEVLRAGFVLRLVGALWQYWNLLAQWSEGRRWLEEALRVASKVKVDKALLAKALCAAANLIRYQFDLARARTLCEQSVALYRVLGDREGLLTALHQLSRILYYQGDDESLRGLLPEIFALAEELPDMPIKAQVYAYSAGMAPLGISSLNVARYLAESERIFRALDSPAGLAFSLLVRASLASAQGDEVRAQALRDEAEHLAAEVEDRYVRMAIGSERIISAWKSGDDASARRYLEQGLVASGEVDPSTGQRRLYPRQPNLFFWVLAAVLHRQGLDMWAARVYGLADKLATTSEPPRIGGVFQKPAAAARAEVRARLGDQVFDRAVAEGGTMTMEDLLAIPHPPADAPTSIPYEPLTARELEVLRLLAQDLNNPQIAERLVVSRRTVEAHLRSIYDKLGVKSRDAAIRFALEHGLVEK